MHTSKQTCPPVSMHKKLLQSKGPQEVEQSSFTPCFLQMNERLGPPKLTQIFLEKSWLVCSKAKETSPFLSVYLKSGRKLKHHCPHPQRCQHEVIPSILMRFTWLLLRRELGIPDFNSKGNLALWALTKWWNSNTCALGIQEWSGTSIPARPIPNVLLQFKLGFVRGLAYLLWVPVEAAAVGCRIQVSLSLHDARSFWQGNAWNACRTKCMKRRGKTEV